MQVPRCDCEVVGVGKLLLGEPAAFKPVHHVLNFSNGAKGCDVFHTLLVFDTKKIARTQRRTGVHSQLILPETGYQVTSPGTDNGSQELACVFRPGRLPAECHFAFGNMNDFTTMALGCSPAGMIVSR